MYAERIQLHNYGPIERLDIRFGFDPSGRPLPAVLVGANGAGKSILLSHIVNGLLAAQSVAYPQSQEVEEGKVYKFRSNSYIPSSKDWYYGRVDFQDGFYQHELRMRKNKEFYSESPVAHLGPEPQGLWNNMKPTEHDSYNHNFEENNEREYALRTLYERNTILYFPPNRFEEPAWLNEENLRSRVQFRNVSQIEGSTDRRVLDYAPLRHNQDWIFNVAFDRSLRNPAVAQYARNIISAVMSILSQIIQEEKVTLGYGPRYSRTLSVERTADDGQMIHGAQRLASVFHLSSGETTVLNLALSILRDFDLANRMRILDFSLAAVRGIAVIDEIDLHLHTSYQYALLPRLLTLLPNVQFIMTTHSPLLPLGMEQEFTSEGFNIFELPTGYPITSERFREFRRAYDIFSKTRRFTDTISQLQKPLLLVEGPTDKRYIEQAACRLGKADLVQGIEIIDGEGSPNLRKLWNGFTEQTAAMLRYPVLLLFDCDMNRPSCQKGKLFQRTIPQVRDNPIQKGIENLFTKATLDHATAAKPAFVDVDHARRRRVRGNYEDVPETWEVNDREKTNLCDWICANGTGDDFEHFRAVFDILEETLVEHVLPIGPTE